MRGNSSYETTDSESRVGVWSVYRGSWRMRLRLRDMVEECGCERECVYFIRECVWLFGCLFVYVFFFGEAIVHLL